jgi:hypothetical protein
VYKRQALASSWQKNNIKNNPSKLLLTGCSL